MSEDRQDFLDPSLFERTRIKLLPLLRLPTGENPLADLYHRMSAIAEVIGYPSPRRHKEFFERQLREAEQKTETGQFNVLLLGAMSPSSILDVLEIVKSSEVKSPSLTVIDISRAPLAAAKTDLEKLASKMGIRLNLVQGDLRALSFQQNYFNVVLADQVYNFLPTKDCVPATRDILNFVAPGGRFVNVIATFREKVPLFGGWDKRMVEDQRRIGSDNCKVEKLPRPLNFQTLIAGPFIGQTAITINKPEVA